jgi:hypothetical protein
MPAQYDALFIRNLIGSGIQFSEEFINIVRGGLLTSSADANRALRWLAGGTEGQYVGVNANGDLEFKDMAAGHSQNSDVSTSSNTFTIDADSVLGKIIIDVALGSVDKALTLSNEALTDNRTILLPDASGTLALTSQLPASPMNYKDVVNCSTNPDYPAAAVGDVYVVSVAGKIGGASGATVEAGDTLICKETAASGDQATVGTKWNIVQKNLDGAVIGPSSVADNAVAVFDGTTGKIIKAHASGALGTMAFETDTNYVPKSLFDAYTMLFADADNTPQALTVGANTLVGRKSSGGIVALAQNEVFPMVYVTAPAAYNSDGTVGQEAVDGNFHYRCTTSGSGGSGRWVRNIVATIW